MKFDTTIELGGKTATGMQVPPEVVAALGSSKKPPVRVTIRGYTYRSTIATLDGKFMLPVSAEVRERAGVAAGDRVVVDLELDTEPRVVIPPPDLQSALDQDPNARQFFEKLSNSNKQRIVIPIESAKGSETRQRRVEKAIENLRQGKV